MLRMLEASAANCELTD